MKTYILLPLLLISLGGVAQVTEAYYDYNWKPTDVGHAMFFSLVKKERDKYHRWDYYIRQKQLQMEGFYADSACKIYDGNFLYFYPNGGLEAKSIFKNNKQEGEYLSFHENGMMRDSFHYENGNRIGTCFSWHPDGMMKDSTITNADGSGVSISWHQNGMPAAAGYFGPGGKKRDTWQFFHFNGKLSSQEKYDQGKLLDKKYFDENGNAEADTTSTDRDVAFPGGSKAFIKYLSNHAYFPDGWEIVNSDAIVVIVTATIDEDGKVINAYVSAPFHPAFDSIALNAMRKSPRWLPAIVHHRRVKSAVRQVITFFQEK